MLEKIEKKILALLAERASLLEEMGVLDKYFVYDNEERAVNNETLVLSPQNGTGDIKLIREYIKSLSNGMLADQLNTWLDGFTTFKCIEDRVCSKINSPLCCAHCPNNTECILDDNSPLCHYVALGEVADKLECQELLIEEE